MFNKIEILVYIKFFSNCYWLCLIKTREVKIVKTDLILW